MVTLAQLWLPILLSTLFVFFISAMINMLLKFWHTPDYHSLSNEDEVRAALRNGNPAPGMYIVPHCKPGAMNDPVMQEKFRVGPVGHIALRAPGAMNIGASLGQWFVFCLLTSVLCAWMASEVFAPAAAPAQLFKVIAVIAFMAHSLGSIPNAMWWGHPWGSEVKYIVDGAVYAVVIAATFVWLWPR